jgi:hypothetical protein
VRVDDKPTALERAGDLYDAAKQDLQIATLTTVVTSAATIDAYFAPMSSGRMVATALAVIAGSGTALIGARAGARLVGAAAFAAIAGVSFLFRRR